MTAWVVSADGCPLLLTTWPVKIVLVEVPAVLVTVRETSKLPLLHRCERLWSFLS